MYIQNRCPHIALRRKTPEEVLTGTRLDVNHIRIFGSVFYCHVHADTRKKLDPSGEKGLLIGYSETSKAYRVYIPARKRIILSRDVQFDEDRVVQRSIDSPREQQPAQDTGIKLEESDVQVQVQTQGIGFGSQRESGGQDPSVIDLEDELQQVDTRPRPKWFRSTV